MISRIKTNKIKTLTKKISLSEGIELTLVINLPKLKKEIETEHQPDIKQGRGLGTLKRLREIAFKGGPKDLSKNIDKYLYAS